MVSVSVRYLFYQPMDEKIKTCTLRFSAKENPNMEKALFDWSIVSQYDVKASIVFSSERSLNQPKATRVCIRTTNQSNRSIFVRLLFLFCCRVFISRSYENRSIVLCHCLLYCTFGCVDEILKSDHTNETYFFRTFTQYFFSFRLVQKKIGIFR